MEHHHQSQVRHLVNELTCTLHSCVSGMTAAWCSFLHAVTEPKNAPQVATITGVSIPIFIIFIISIVIITIVYCYFKKQKKVSLGTHCGAFKVSLSTPTTINLLISLEVFFLCRFIQQNKTDYSKSDITSLVSFLFIYTYVLVSFTLQCCLSYTTLITWKLILYLCHFCFLSYKKYIM